MCDVGSSGLLVSRCLVLAMHGSDIDDCLDVLLKAGENNASYELTDCERRIVHQQLIITRPITISSLAGSNTVLVSVIS